MSNETVLETVPRTMDEVVACLGMAYNAWKEHGQAKDQYRDEFFRLADEAIKRQGLALKLVDITAPSEEIAIERAKRHYPGWLIDTHRPHRIIEGQYEIVLIEDPSLKPHEHEYEGVKYARTIRRGSVMIDDEWLKEEDPELYEEVVYVLPWGATVMRPVETLDKEAIGRLSKYIYNDKPKVALSAPRPIKEEE